MAYYSAARQGFSPPLPSPARAERLFHHLTGGASHPTQRRGDMGGVGNYH